MATWQEMSLDNRRAAQRLLEDEHFRSSISRAYYAAYCAAAGELVARNISFPHGWNNPAHDQIPDLILNNTSLPRNRRYEINKALRRLRKSREDADYRPAMVMERRDAVNALRDTSFVIRALEIEEDE